MNLKEIIENGKNTQYYKDYNNIVNELNYYRDNVYPMTDAQGNTFRHQAGAAAMTQKYNPFITNFYGVGKEIEDYFIKHKSGKDSLGDIKNNLYGSIIGQVAKNAPRNTLYDWIYKGINKQ